MQAFQFQGPSKHSIVVSYKSPIRANKVLITEAMNPFQKNWTLSPFTLSAYLPVSRPEMSLPSQSDLQTKAGFVIA